MTRWIGESLELNVLMRRAHDNYNLTCHEEPMPKEVLESLAAEVKKSHILCRFANEFLEAKSISETYRILRRVFDEADARNVWCGI